MNNLQFTYLMASDVIVASYCDCDNVI